MKAFYNEIEPYCCAWLQNLMDKGLITPGTICDTPVQNLTAEDVKGYDRCHFFAGIAGWEIALQIAWWGDRPVWTGSAPCQPFSVAGKGKAQQDERHLWPVWFNLIRQSRPEIVFGEQVPAAIGHGWWDDVADDLEREGYATWAQIRPACSVGAPHRRDRLWFVANSVVDRHEGRPREFAASSAMENADSGRLRQSGICEKQPRRAEAVSAGKTLADAAQQRINGRGDARKSRRNEPANGGADVADSHHPRPQRHGGLQECACEQSAWASGGTVHPGWQSDAGICRISPRVFNRTLELRTGQKVVETPSRTGMLKAYGNSIVPAVAAEFIRAYMDRLNKV